MPANSIRTFKADMILSDIGRFVSTIASMPELTHVTVGCFTCSHAADRPVEVLSPPNLVNPSHTRLLLQQSSSYHHASTPTKFSLAVSGTRERRCFPRGTYSNSRIWSIFSDPVPTRCARLHILYLPIDTKDLILMLESIPRLRELVIHWPQVPQASIETTIQYLADTRTLHLAQLTSLELVWCQDVDEEMIIDMVEVRMACTRLRRVTLWKGHAPG